MNTEIIDAGRDISDGYKVDVSRGTNVDRVSSEWFSRPDDERYLSLDDLFSSVKGRAERSRTRTVESAAIRVEAHRDNPDKLCLVLPGADEPIAPTHWSFGQLSSLVGAPAAYPPALPEELLGAIEVGQDHRVAAPVDGNFTLGGRGPVRPTDRISRELLEKAPEIDVVVVDVALRDFGRANVARRDLARACVRRRQRCGRSLPDNHHGVVVIIDQVEILLVRNRRPGCQHRRLHASGLNAFGAQDHFRCCAGILTSVMVLEHEVQMLLEACKAMAAVAPQLRPGGAGDVDTVACPSSYKMGHQSGLSIGGSGSFA